MWNINLFFSYTTSVKFSIPHGMSENNLDNLVMVLRLNDKLIVLTFSKLMWWLSHVSSPQIMMILYQEERRTQTLKMMTRGWGHHGHHAIPGTHQAHCYLSSHRDWLFPTMTKCPFQKFLHTSPHFIQVSNEIISSEGTTSSSWSVNFYPFDF